MPLGLSRCLRFCHEEGTLLTVNNTPTRAIRRHWQMQWRYSLMRAAKTNPQPASQSRFSGNRQSRRFHRQSPHMASSQVSPPMRGDCSEDGEFYVQLACRSWPYASPAAMRSFVARRRVSSFSGENASFRSTRRPIMLVSPTRHRWGRVPCDVDGTLDIIWDAVPEHSHVHHGGGGFRQRSRACLFGCKGDVNRMAQIGLEILRRLQTDRKPN